MDTTPGAFKVRVVGSSGSIVFQASSPIMESRSINYDTHAITHLPTDLFSYRNTSARHFTVQGKLVSRTANEATANAGYVSLVRAWALPDFAGSGSTPPILKLYAYNSIDINGRSVILRSYSLAYPDDVDYIYTGAEPMPVIMTLTLEFDEIYSAEEITAKKWKIVPRSGGSFVGGNTTAINQGTLLPTPRGIASASILAQLGSPSSSNVGELPSIPASTLGINSDARISDATALVGGAQVTGNAADSLTLSTALSQDLVSFNGALSSLEQQAAATVAKSVAELSTRSTEAAGYNRQLITS